MDINTWLTVVTIFIGILTILPKEERTLLQLKLHRFEYVSFSLLLIFVIPFLILYPQIAQRWPVLSKFTISNGFQPGNIGFAIFYLLFLWIIIRFLIIRPVGRINRKIIDFFSNALVELPFPQFFSLFTRYSLPLLQKKSWGLYKEVILQPEFLKGISQHRPSFVYNVWGLLRNEEEFKMVFRPFISDINSVYYEEIKANDGSDTILGTLPFLNSVLVKSIVNNKKNGLLFILSDFSKQQIRSEKGKTHSIYLQPHHYYHTTGEEGYDLPVYYHIRFIALMYSTAITNKVEIGTHMHTLYQGMIDEMINNLNDDNDYNNQGEYPTNYHWLIGRIFSSTNRWLEYFGGEHTITADDNIPESSHIYFRPRSSYVDFIPSCMNFCCKSLYKGIAEKKISVDFVSKLIYYNILSEYFSHDLKDEMRHSIEENVLNDIPQKYLGPILELTLDEEFASSFIRFREKGFSGSKSEVILQLRLWNFLRDKKMI